MSTRKFQWAVCVSINSFEDHKFNSNTYFYVGLASLKLIFNQDADTDIDHSVSEEADISVPDVSVAEPTVEDDKDIDGILVKTESDFDDDDSHKGVLFSNCDGKII